MRYAPISLAEKFGKFSDRWSPKIIARLNDYHVKLGKIQGEFIWHSHDNTDELFLVLEGRMRIELRDGGVDIEGGEMYVVPKGAEHKPCSEKECHIMMVELAGTRNTGSAGGERTSEDNVWV